MHRLRKACCLQNLMYGSRNSELDVVLDVMVAFTLHPWCVVDAQTKRTQMTEAYQGIYVQMMYDYVSFVHAD